MEVSQYPPRFKISGVVLNVFQRPSGTGKDGKAYGGEFVAQVMSCDHLKNGESRLVPTDLVIGEDDVSKFKASVGKVGEWPCTVWVNSVKQMVIALASGKAVQSGSK
jgi:hypothetical protein